MSRATTDRCLKKTRFTHSQHGLSTTKPGSPLKKAIPIRTFTPREDEHPGFLEIDLVAHCGLSTEGIYLNTFTATDIATGWTECLALPNMTQNAVSRAICELRQNLPSPLRFDRPSPFVKHNPCTSEHQDIIDIVIGEKFREREIVVRVFPDIHAVGVVIMRRQ